MAAQRFAAVVVVVLAAMMIVGAAACGAEPPTPPPSPVATAAPQATPSPVATTAPQATPTAAIGKTSTGRTEIKIYLSEATGKYQTGSAILTDIGGRTQVLVNVEPAMANAQPIHIHMGTCAAVGTISDKLEDVVVGKSSTEIAKPLAEIASGGKVVNVHLSASEIRTYTACGEIPALP